MCCTIYKMCCTNIPTQKLVIILYISKVMVLYIFNTNFK